jgi:hypothetical protein
MGIKHLALGDNNNITDDGLSYVKNLELLYCCKNMTDFGLSYVPKLKVLICNNNILV